MSMTSAMAIGWCSGMVDMPDERVSIDGEVTYVLHTLPRTLLSN